MPRSATEFSVADLERILDQRKSQAQELEKRRDQLIKELANTEAELQAIVGTKQKGAKRGAKKGVRRGKRVQNQRSLREYIFEILAKSKKGLTLPDLEVKVPEAGYKSTSKNFSNMIYQCLYNNSESIAKDPETGGYQLIKEQ